VKNYWSKSYSFIMAKRDRIFGIIILFHHYQIKYTYSIQQLAVLAIKGNLIDKTTQKYQVVYLFELNLIKFYYCGTLFYSKIGDKSFGVDN
jgi:hypothetical protein